MLALLIVDVADVVAGGESIILTGITGICCCCCCWTGEQGFKTPNFATTDALSNFEFWAAAAVGAVTVAVDVTTGVTVRSKFKLAFFVNEGDCVAVEAAVEPGAAREICRPRAGVSHEDGEHADDDNDKDSAVTRDDDEVAAVEDEEFLILSAIWDSFKTSRGGDFDAKTTSQTSIELLAASLDAGEKINFFVEVELSVMVLGTTGGGGGGGNVDRDFLSRASAALGQALRTGFCCNSRMAISSHEEDDDLCSKIWPRVKPAAVAVVVVPPKFFWAAFSVTMDDEGASAAAAVAVTPEGNITVCGMSCEEELEEASWWWAAAAAGGWSGLLEGLEVEHEEGEWGTSSEGEGEEVARAWSSNDWGVGEGLLLPTTGGEEEEKWEVTALRPLLVADDWRDDEEEEEEEEVVGTTTSTSTAAELIDEEMEGIRESNNGGVETTHSFSSSRSFFTTSSIKSSRYSAGGGNTAEAEASGSSNRPSSSDGGGNKCKGSWGIITAAAAGSQPLDWLSMRSNSSM